LARAFNIKSDQPELIKAKDIEAAYAYLGEEVEIGTGAVKKLYPFTAASLLEKSKVCRARPWMSSKSTANGRPNWRHSLPGTSSMSMPPHPTGEPVVPIPSESEHETAGVITEVSGKTRQTMSLRRD
jgi:hypothetical protein